MARGTLQRLLVLALGASGCEHPVFHDVPAPPGYGDAGPPGISQVAASPNPSRSGDRVTITFQANQAVETCAAEVAGQAATCSKPDGNRCRCTLLVTSLITEGSHAIAAAASNDKGTGNGRGAQLQVDNTAPSVNGTSVALVRHALLVDDGVMASAGTFSDAGIAYDGRRVRLVRVWASVDATEPWLEVEPEADGGLAEVSLPGSDGGSPATLAPARLFVSAVDVPGNESTRVEVSGADTGGPLGDGGAMTIDRNDLTTPDAVLADGTFTDTSALLEVRVYDAAADGNLLGAIAAAPDGSVAEIPIGTATASYGRVFVSAVDKCGNEGARVEAELGADSTPPALLATGLTFVRRPQGISDGASADAGAVSDTTSQVRAVRLYAEGTGGAALLTVTPTAGGFSQRDLGDTALDRVFFEAEDKAGNVSARLPAGNVDATLSLAGRTPRDASSSPMSLYAFAADVDPRTSAPGFALVMTTEVSAASSSALSIADAERLITSASPESADVASAWQRVPVGGPPARYGHNLAYDSARERVVLFGGMDSVAATVYHDDTWEFDGVFWERRIIVAPPARYRAAMAYDARRGVVVLHGGMQADDKTWEYDGDAWSDAQVTGPSARSHHTMAYDEQNEVVVTYGANGTVLASETWEYDGAWTPTATTASAGAFFGHAMSYAGGGKVILFGNGNPPYDETWQYAAGAWGPVAATEPPGRTLAAMAWDSARGKVVMFGGSFGTLFGDTWEYDSGTWAAKPTATSPPARRDHAMTYDAARSEVVLFGGEIDSEAGRDTWTFDGATWNEVPTALNPPGVARFVMAYDAVRGRVVAFGGIGGDYDTSFDQTWELDGERWRHIPTTSSPPGGGGHAMVYDAERGVMVLYVGGSSMTTWEYDGDWRLVSTEHTPGRPLEFGLAYDAARGRVILACGIDFGGGLYEGTWEYDGVDWTQTTDDVFNRCQLAYDAGRGTVVLVGWSGTYEYDGDWQLVSTATSLGARDGHRLAYDPRRGRTMLFGGGTPGGSDYPDELWQFDGNDWSTLTAAPGPLGRRHAGLIHDAQRGGLLTFGGEAAFMAGSYDDHSDTWEHEVVTPHARHAAQVALLRLDPSATPSTLKVTYVGSGSGAAGAGVEVLVWRWTTETWVSLGTHAAVDSASAAARTIDASPSGPPADYLRAGRLFVLVTTTSASSAPPGTVASVLSSDRLEVAMEYALP